MGRLTRAQVARVMRANTSKWTGPERRLHGWLKALHVRHRMHPPGLVGSPDCAVERADGTRVLVFVDGCFWHGHRCKPRNLTPKWRRKIDANRRRDQAVSRSLRGDGWTVVRIWECRLTLDRVAKVAGRRRSIR